MTAVVCADTAELAVVSSVGALGGCKMASSWVGRLAWTPVTSFVGPEMLGGRVWVEIDKLSTL